MLLSLFALSSDVAEAADIHANSLLKCLSNVTVNTGSEEVIATSLIREDNFESDKLESIDLRHVGCGSLSQENTFHLTHGNALFTPKKDIVVLTAFGKIHIGSGSVVCILKPEAGVVSIYNLHSGNGKKVSLEIGQQSFALFPSVQATLCYQICDFASINPAKRIAYRNLKAKDLSSGMRLYSAEFSIPSAIEHIGTLRNMFSSNNKEDQKIADQIIKDYVIFEQLCDAGESYAVAKEPERPDAIPTRMAAVTANTQIDPDYHLIDNPLANIFAQ